MKVHGLIHDRIDADGNELTQKQIMVTNYDSTETSATIFGVKSIFLK